MQQVSSAYKLAMRQPYRNRGYITARIGIISSTAQDNVVAPAEDNNFAYYANNEQPFKTNTVDRLYATMEQDFSKVDGTMYFLPEEYEEFQYYNNGLVTSDLMDAIYITFDGNVADVKGLTINFGEYYPTSFTVECDNGERAYSNSEQIFITEDTFDAIRFLKITPLSMVNGEARMRVLEFTCGISNTFSNKQVKEFTYKDYVSTICESLPSQDMTLTVDNQNLYYNPDNPKSAVAYMEQGQQMKVSFGYDIDGNGTIEWVSEITTFLKSWSANDTEAKFTMVDILEWKLNGTYYKGLYRADGISLYDLALDVLNDAGMKEDEYQLDPYMKNVMVCNPIPAVKHSEALQIIANAGRCVLSVDRQGRINIMSSFKPDMNAKASIDFFESIYPRETAYPSSSIYPILSKTAKKETAFSHAENILKSDSKTAYAMFSNDFTTVDGMVLFLPENESECLGNTGYVSDSVADENGYFGNLPKISIELEAGYICYGVSVRFRNTAPQKYSITTYYQGEQVQKFYIENPDLVSVYAGQLYLFDLAEIVFEKGYPNARVAVDSVSFGDSTDYTLSRDFNLNAAPTATRQEKIKAISVKRNIYSETKSAEKDLATEEIKLDSSEITKTIYLTEPSYGFSVAVTSGDATAEIVASSNYFVDLKISGAIGETVKFALSGYEYVVDERHYTKIHNDTGVVKTWDNPIVSDESMAKNLEEWLSEYYLSDVDYQIEWNGDPRTDANDLFFLELKDRDDVMIRAYQNELSYSGAWSGALKARKVVGEE